MNPGPQSSNHAAEATRAKLKGIVRQAMTDASNDGATDIQEYIDYVVEGLIEDGHAIPNRVQPGTFGPVFDAGVEEGKRQARRATPDRAQAQDSLADQVTRVIRMANDAGERDAADWMLSMWREKAWRT